MLEDFSACKVNISAVLEALTSTAVRGVDMFFHAVRQPRRCYRSFIALDQQSFS